MPQPMWNPGEEGTGAGAGPGAMEKHVNRVGDQETSEPTAIYNPYFTGRPRTPSSASKPEVVDRQQIIRKIKEKGIARQRSLEARLASQENSGAGHSNGVRYPSIQAALLPSPDIERSERQPESLLQDVANSGLEISRPRSALHRGDFSGSSQTSWDDQSQADRVGLQDYHSRALLATSPPAPWHDGYPNTTIHRARLHQPAAPSPLTANTTRPRAASQTSLSRSFNYQPPSSPLVNQSNAEDNSDPDDLPLPNPDFASDRFNRRRTFSPRSLQSFAHMLDGNYETHWSSSPPSARRESTIPCKAHQPRRSVTSFNSSPQTPFTASRRSSTFGSSPLQSAMVGSFEESILRGRMSSTPSKPLDFTAHIGVLGMGDCKANLKCPPHVTIPFPAVYYNYGISNTSSDSQPSPYVGLVDLENRSPIAKTMHEAKPRPDITRMRSTQAAVTASETTAMTGLDAAQNKRRRQKHRRRSRSPLQEPKGAYRIPPKGQLQIIIKNPHKTAVKLFLVPYDVSEIQPGQKTFIRQRSYSAGPILDIPIDAKKLHGTDRPEAAPSLSKSQDRPVLRYLIHLNICCTSKGRVWLYKSVRVVFANRVPDGKEKLRNEVQLPEPRYSSYKPGHSSAVATPLLKAQASNPMPMDIDGIGSPTSPPIRSAGSRPGHEARSLPATSVYDNLFTHRHTEPSFRFPLLETVTSRPASRGDSDELHSSRPTSRQAEPVQRVRSPKSPMSPLSPLLPLQRAMSPVTDSSEGTGSITFSRSSSTEKLMTTGSESLLSRRLRDLGMRRAPSPAQGQEGGGPS
ncbi:Protein FAM214A [Sphaceloma murrayae]|uniref:Protein FAM214A n=1 Tax=Sphaceloma murrayae TaxID=2082308 RepID=A0A2K1QKJ1_9PEZI|nr:Protein FAM214A [Sphaceloma murrayae]